MLLLSNGEGMEQNIADCGLQISDLRRQRAWGREHGAVCSRHQASAFARASADRAGSW
jgi:hypothetical protein